MNNNMRMNEVTPEIKKRPTIQNTSFRSTKRCLELLIGQLWRGFGVVMGDHETQAEASPFPSTNTDIEGLHATEMSRRATLRAIEFFSGIGGYHAATQVAGLPIRVISAFDINSDANKVYNFNFGRGQGQTSPAHTFANSHSSSASSDHASPSVPTIGKHASSTLNSPISVERVADVRASITKPTASAREYSTSFTIPITTKASTESIENLSLANLDGASDNWMMSPPCQPFTRAGARRDHTDNRTRPFLHLLDTLQRMVSSAVVVLGCLERLKGLFNGSLVWTL